MGIADFSMSLEHQSVELGYALSMATIQFWDTI